MNSNRVIIWVIDVYSVRRKLIWKVEKLYALSAVTEL